MKLNKYITSLASEVKIPLLIITIFIIYYFRLWDIKIDVPFAYDGDSLLHLALIKTMVESGWVFFNSHLGAPFGLNFFDFPGADGLFLILLRFLTLLSSNSVVVLNVFYILGFVLIFFSAFLVFRKFQISIWLSSAGALIYTCLPFHFLRGVNHLYLSMYFIVPLLILLAFSIYPGCNKANPTTLKKITPSQFLILLAGGMCGIYFAFFGILIIGLTGLIGTIQLKKYSILRNSIIAISIITIGVFVNLAPSIWYRTVEGINPEIAQRSPIESEMYGLRMTQLLLPIEGHNSSGFAKITRKYQGNINITEATSSALGIISGIGFIFLLGVILFGRNTLNDDRINVLAKLNLASFLFATIGGAGVLFALIVMPEFRGLNRISVYVGFFSLLGLLVLIQTVIDNLYARTRYAKLIAVALAIMLMLLATYDQIPVGARGQNPAIENAFREDRLFISQIENTVKPNAMIYQAPYLAFPESAPLNDEGYNGMLRPYLNSTSLRWSYGAMKGRMGDTWLKELETLPLAARLKALEATGFEGLYIERRAYKDHGLELERELKQILLEPPLVSRSKNNAFYRLNPSKPLRVTPTLTLVASTGFHAWEVSEDGRRFVWGDSKVKLLMFNFDSQPIKVEFHASLSSLNSERVVMHRPGEDGETIRLRPGQKIEIEKEFILKPGKNVLIFETDRPAIKVSGDQRNLALQLTQPELKLVTVHVK
jgi:phosphoglycerol transferase